MPKATALVEILQLVPTDARAVNVDVPTCACAARAAKNNTSASDRIEVDERAERVSGESMVVPAYGSRSVCFSGRQRHECMRDGVLGLKQALRTDR